MIKKDKILVALSGGVDSAVVLYLLKKQGYNVEAAFMKNFSAKVNIKGECPWIKDRLEAYRVAAYLKIPIRTFNFEKEYHDKIVKYIFDSYKNGRTPNPDVLCNNEIKFKLFLDKARKLGFDKIATGHYAQIKHDKNGYHLLRGHDKNKDQSYFLAGLNQNQLARTFFPIGHLSKPQVRTLAKKAKLPNHNRPDSQGICFIGKIDLKTFLSQKIKPKTGDIVDTKGNVLGQHQGVWYYTIGQRHGLNLSGGPWYVTNKDIKHNQLIVGHIDSSELYKKVVQIGPVHFLAKTYKLPLKAEAQIRYRQPAQTVTININRHLALDAGSSKIPASAGMTYTAKFATPQKSVASGQTLAIYKNQELIASAAII